MALPHQKRLELPHEPWDKVALVYRRQLIRTFEELMRAEAIFAGPSLYADR